MDAVRRGDGAAGLRLTGRWRRLAGEQRRNHDRCLVVVLRKVVADARRLEELEVPPVGEHHALAVAHVAVLVREQAVIVGLRRRPGCRGSAAGRGTRGSNRRGRNISRRLPVCTETPTCSPRPRKFLVLMPNSPEKKPSSWLQPPPNCSSVRSDSFALEEKVDLLLLGIGVDVDRVLLVELEVAELVDLGDAVADRRHVDQAPLVDPQLAAQHLVLGALVALELDAPDLELVPLGDVDDQVGDPVLALDQLGLDAGEDVAGVVVGVGGSP